MINLDKLTYAGNLQNLAGIEEGDHYRFVKADICDASAMEELFVEEQVDSVVHFAAESHVDRSIAHPEVFLNTNILGTQVLLDIAKKHWKINDCQILII